MPKAKAVPSKPAANDKLAERIREDVIRGVWRSGERLNEGVLAQRYRVSRVPLREALRLLEGQGFVQTRPRQGAYVPELSIEDFLDVHEVRLALEATALRLAVPRLNEALLDRLRQLAREADESGESELYFRSVTLFYEKLYSIIGRPRLCALLELMLSRERRYVELFLSLLDAYRPDMRNMQDLVEVLGKGDAEEAIRFQTERLWEQFHFLARHVNVFSEANAPRQEE